jgi:hypothetical protein
MIGDLLTRVWTDLIGRIGGPLTFRLILQPAMAIFFAIRDVLQDARQGRPAYFWALFTEPAHRRDLLREGWKAVAKVFVIAFIIDVIYQFIVLRWVYPGEALLTAFILAFVPYLLVRGPVNRIARLWQRRTAASDPGAGSV